MKRQILIIIAVVFLLFMLAFATVPNDMLDATDVKDFSDTAKYFAGDYHASLRASHSVLYGLMLAPYVALTGNFMLLKLSSAFFFVLLILSVYHLSGRDKRTLYLFLASPLIWYMAPWVSPVPLATLFILWAFHFQLKFEREEKVKYAMYSGLLFGLAGAFWATALYLSVIFLLCYYYNKKLRDALLFAVFVIIGFSPAMILDQLLFNFALYSLIKHMSSSLLFALYGGIYQQGYSTGILNRILVILFVPFSAYLLFNKKMFKENKKTIIFLIASLAFILLNPQIRLVLVIAPIVFVLLANKLNDRKFKIVLALSVILYLLAIMPYLIQIKYDTNARYLALAVEQFPNIQITNEGRIDLIRADLNEIEKLHPNEIFLVGNENDAYRELAHYYWGIGIKEFVSIEDYLLYQQNKTTIASKKISSSANIPSRREIWFALGIDKSSNFEADYSKINYAIGFEPDFAAREFKQVRKYGILYLFEK